ncbi:ABC transporter substrate-binding protein [Paenibacillus flagellatus]|uniref:ABC transporter substrate-binding protein n=1 Tax=Paenibacillus flagellatus TaxID=2211139 RepID=A0A2V5K9Y2_9BACL|nr:ABC transporter substrate-binding protein [Paenibacillus flagellatus]PYI56218.1 ABC transporter substrate-binding protein [Paenibacillus flagellatus]
MKQTFKAAAGTMLVFSLLASACSGNGSGQTGGADSSGQQDPNKPTELTVFAPQSPAIENLETNRFTKKVEEKANVKIKWNVVPEKSLEDKKQLMMASGDYPAVLLGGNFNKADQLKYGQQGAFLDLKELIDKHAPNVKKAMNDLPYLKAAMTAPNGSIYAIPKINECFHCTYGQKMWINKSWLDKLGLAMPTTTDEFYEVLKAFKEKDPNGNGKPDEVPLTTSYDMWAGGVDSFLMNAFIYDDMDSYFSLSDGKVRLSAAQPEWREGLRYLRKLYAEGLIDKAAFTQNADAVKQLASKPEQVVGAVSTALISYLYTANDENPRHKEFEVVPPLKGPNGVRLSSYSVGAGNGQFVLTNKATKEQQIAAMRLADYLYSEEATVLTSWGFEGEGWRRANAGETDYNGKPAQYAVIPSTKTAQVQNDSWQQLGIMLMTNAIREGFVAPKDPLGNDGYEYRLWKESKKYEPYGKPETVYPSDVYIDPADATLAAQLRTTIKDYVKSSMAQFITGSKDIEKDWDAYIAGFKGLQLDKYAAIYQKALNK